MYQNFNMQVIQTPNLPGKSFSFKDKIRYIIQYSLSLGISYNNLFKLYNTFKNKLQNVKLKINLLFGIIQIKLKCKHV